ncbi:hypothetical protein NC653_019260 [Populus alba x Populus x berolinensis]|uniref:Uncharacterized protein n=1 Tax=Populus alba x Populus x berolinensis TaxID=444605 RepID=A0AAD6VX28_9ROSI|nr:hypothetical protein NC653_019260 [Populus alba x Populus x berolinensis]
MFLKKQMSCLQSTESKEWEQCTSSSSSFSSSSSLKAPAFVLFAD